ncbi:MAG TPA: hypothetical protein VF791_24050 [Pyrinomonadaceae bacterium]
MRLLTTLYGDVSNPDGRAVPDDVIQGFDLSPDGSTLVCTYFPATLIIWDTQTGRRKKVVEHPAGFGPVSFSPDGTMFVTAHGNLVPESESGSVRFWSAKTFKEIAKIKSVGYVSSVEFSPDGKNLAIVSEKASGPENNPEYKTIVELWDVQTKKLAAVQPAGERDIVDAGFSPDGSKLVTSTKQAVEVWDVKTGELLKSLQGHQGDVSAATFSPDGNFLVSAASQQTTAASNPVGELIIWSVSDGQKVKTLPGYFNFSFTPDGKLIASKLEGPDSLIDIKTGSVTSKIPQLSDWRFSRNGSRAASADDLVVVRVWQVLK